ncbi:BTAD domain-containing putative transcriptional regulator [Streptomyces longispororuber]|uniref:AfsR/SARP family transcriptional regulator n=1 Tax=Streptomyces longispororuber TaxID=68230 RepID=UPI00340831DA
MSCSLSFGLLGPLEVHADGHRVPIGSARQRAVLVMLLLHRDRVVSVSTLIAAVWPDEPPATARNQIAICVAALRKTFRETAGVTDLIHTVHPGYRLDATGHRVDVGELSDALAEARRAAADERLAAAACHFERALSLWRGTALDGLSGGGIDHETARLAESWLSLNEEYAAVLLRLGEHRAVVVRLTAFVAEHPLREEARLLLMRAHHLAGQRAEALEVYRQGRRALAEELGIEPGAALRELHNRILQDTAGRDTAGPARQVPAQAASGAAPGGAAPAYATGTTLAATGLLEPEPAWAARAVPAQLPLPPASFTARAREIEALDGLLPGRRKPGTVGIAVVSGRGGVGKSSLAVYWANRVADQFPDGQLFIDVRGYHEHDQPVTPMSVLDQSLRALGVPSAHIPATLPECAALYRSMLDGKRILVVLDDVSSYAQVKTLLPGLGDCCVLITGRDSLDELTAEFAALRIDLKGLGRSEAVDMLTAAVGPERVRAEPDEAAQLADLCDRLPLALRIAATRLATRPHWTLRHLVTQLEDRRRRLDMLSPNDGGVRASFWMSYRELPTAAARLYRLLGLLTAPDFAAWTGAALLGVGPHEAEELIEQLVEAQLLEVCPVRPGRPTRYRFQDLLRLYAVERSAVEDPAAAREAALDRVFTAAAGLAAAAHEKLYGKGAVTAGRQAPLPADLWLHGLLADPLEWFDAERETLVALVTHAAQTGRAEHAWSLAAYTVPLFETRNYHEDWQRTADSALAASRRAGDALGEGTMLRSLGTLAIYRRRYPEAQALLTDALRVLDGVGDQQGLAMVLRNLALCSRFHGDLAMAARHCGDALEAFARTDDLSGRAHALGLLAQIELERGDSERGIELCRKAVEASDEAGSPRGKAQNIYRLAEALLCVGVPQQAEDACRNVIALTRRQGDRLGEVYGLRALGEALWRQNLPYKAEAALTEALAASEGLGDTFLQARIETDLACAEALRGDRRAAQRLRRAHESFGRLAAPSWQQRTERLLRALSADGSEPRPAALTRALETTSG